MLVKCYSCGEEVDSESVRTIANCLEVCPECYRHLKGLIFDGYFDSEETVADEVVYEDTVKVHFNYMA